MSLRTYLTKRIVLSVRLARQHRRNAWHALMGVDVDYHRLMSRTYLSIARNAHRRLRELP